MELLREVDVVVHSLEKLRVIPPKVVVLRCFRVLTTRNDVDWVLRRPNVLPAVSRGVLLKGRNSVVGEPLEMDKRFLVLCQKTRAITPQYNLPELPIQGGYYFHYHSGQ